MQNEKLKISSFLITLVLLNLSIYAQGFDWQYSARLPSDSPRTFFGLSGKTGYITHTGNFSFFEETSECCKFKNGDGVELSLALKTEHWQSPETALFAELGYTDVPGIFKALNTVPLDPVNNLTTEFTFDSHIPYVFLEVGAKRRLFEDHLFAGASMQLGWRIGDSFVYTEKVISPEDYFFNTNPPTQERSISRGRLNDLNRVMILPNLFVGYDLNLGNGAYASPQLKIAFPITSISKDEEWRRISIFFSISIVKGFDL